MSPDASELLGEAVGLFPAAGRGTRLPGVVGSKELVPVPLRPGEPPRPVVEAVLESFQQAGIRRVLGVLRAGKWDLPEHLAGHLAQHLARHPVDQGAPALGWVIVEESGSVVESLAAALPFAGGSVVALGFPDVILEPRDGFTPLAGPLAAGADVVLGLYPNDRPGRSDIVELGEAGEVRRILVKDPGAGAGRAWMTALWRPAFTTFFLSRWRSAAGGRGAASGRGAAARSELYPGDLFNAAIADGMRIVAVPFKDASALDIGTPEDLERVARGS